MSKPPDVMRLSFEKFLLDITEPLDPLISLKLTQLSLSLAETAYSMGYQDGQHQPTASGTCGHCPYSVTQHLDH
ncbi:MAG: hypothetical protein ACFCU9_15425 [Cyanophyceae cyanobacterium]